MQNEKSSSSWQLRRPNRWRSPFFIFWVVLIAIALWLFYPRPQPIITQGSNYAIHKRQDFNQTQFYPLNQTVNPDLYQPVAEWVGRLILPTPQQIPPGEDWVWMEVQHAPTELQQLVGQVVRLEWQDQPELKSYVQAVQQDIKFTQETKNSAATGIIHPSRLDGRLKVGPLQSLAGARPNDDLIVTLDDVKLLESNSGQPRLQIAHEPVLATGRFYGLVKILSPAAKVCPENTTCANDLFQVRHYNRTSRQFDGVEEIIRIPQQVVDRRNIPPSTPNQLENSPAGKAGWYIYGGKNAAGVFVVQGLVPRSLLQLQPDKIISGKAAGLNYIKNENWQITPQDQGTIGKVLLNPTATSSHWQEGDKAILLHNFGGIGGKKAENFPAFTVTGHFAFGLAQVVREPITQELQFAIDYLQIYANNSDGIISGTHTWADYMGNLQWGWAATRPISDVLMKFAPVTQNYNFGGIKLSPVTEFQQQLQVMMARYRTGDGTGGATVSPATSCVQDSSQALYIAIQVITEQVAKEPAIQQWLNTHPNDPQTSRFQELVSLGEALENQLTPLGIVRADWQSHADYLMGTGKGQKTFRDRSIWAALTSWRTMLPRQAQDELAALFLRHDAQLWFLRTNQIGGLNPDIAPLAATMALGYLTIPGTNIAPITILLNRFLASIVLPQSTDWLVVAGTLLIYTAIALPLGLKTGFLYWSFTPTQKISQFKIALQSAISPALTEELVFRVLPLPHPIEVINWYQWGLWAGFILVLFIIYHPLNARTFFRTGYPTFFQPIFLTLAGLLGLCCTVAYALTGSFWVIFLIHWIIVVVWLLAFGGQRHLIAE
ncbi:CPBP family glutamic-type intramembrane protease [Anabaena sp. CA = ATCC 33047]|uniref:CPBP family glutamic-type intramembrane protease n=1 Tax=Anabaena sp. (strain CA / ATCC 33047) TaxID=52271 RepID=UPI0008320F34|nr:CPBP family glutamic-type intramembrane protease [Anabaena sp. CA = ATCC 33047]